MIVESGRLQILFHVRVFSFFFVRSDHFFARVDLVRIAAATTATTGARKRIRITTATVIVVRDGKQRLLDRRGLVISSVSAVRDNYRLYLLYGQRDHGLRIRSGGGRGYLKRGRIRVAKQRLRLVAAFKLQVAMACCYSRRSASAVAKARR